MQKLHSYVFEKILKSAILPIVFVELLLIGFIFTISFYQSQSNKSLILEHSKESFETLTLQVAMRMDQEFENVKNDATALKEIIQSSFENPNLYAKTNLHVQYDQGFYILNSGEKASVYTTNITKFGSSDKKSLELLNMAISPIDALAKSYEKKIDAVWVNLGKYYSLYYPKINLHEELSPDLDSTKQSYYFHADQEHNPQRQTIFIPLFNEPWALSQGQIGAVVSPIYKGEEMLGVVGVSLTAENTEKLSAIDLPFEAYVLIEDKEGYLLFSSDEARSRKDFSVSSFTGLCKESKKEALKRIHRPSQESSDFIFHEHQLGNSGLNLVLVARKSEVSKEIETVFNKTQKVGIAVLVFIIFLHLYFYRRLKLYAAKMTGEISNPVSDIADASNKLFQEEAFGFAKSDIEELSVLHENLERAHEKLINQLYMDALTNLPNQRKLLMDVVPEDTLILIRVENFKSISNIYGPDIAEEILLLFVSQLQQLYTDQTRIYRVYNDTFALRLCAQSAISKESLAWHYEKIKQIQVIKDTIPVALNFSLSLAKGAEESEFSLFARAEIALDEAHKQDHINYVTFDKNRHLKNYKENLHWAKKLQDALDQYTLVAFFQPIYDMKTGRVYKFESLVRMQDGSEIISPFYFLGAAARMGKLSAITSIMLKQVFSIAVRYPDVEFSINISFEDFEQADLLSEIKELLLHHKLKASNIIFEILETGSMKDEEKIIEVIEEIKSLGCKIAIDDFGTGNSNFAYLMLMQVDYIKIDGQFIKDISSDPQSLNITKTIKAFADMTGAKTIAEFVSEKTSFDAIKDLDIDYAQGYYISEPKPASQIDDMLCIIMKD